ncbi:SRPBCC family protein [Catalinimonas sp. 4WD22]|uniref:SRPBCC family protein n=1 Tax=Catalinimonas locisalis TaxID=3133978 RepID=UPI003100D5B7
MKSIKRTFLVGLSAHEAFHKFIKELGEWWPREYSWSQDKLESISIEARKDGLCTEIGPHGFRADWGRVIEIDVPQLIVFKWQISPQRVPEPDPSKSSEVSIKFEEVQSDSTRLLFEHRNFEKHGEDAEEYRQAMDSERGWDYILALFLKYAAQH